MSFGQHGIFDNGIEARVKFRIRFCEREKSKVEPFRGKRGNELLTGWMVEKAELEAQAKVADELKRSSAVKAKLEAVIEELEQNLSEQAAQKAELESR